MRRKVTGIIIAVALVAAFAGCGKEKTENDAGNTAQEAAQEPENAKGDRPLSESEGGQTPVEEPEKYTWEVVDGYFCEMTLPVYSSYSPEDEPYDVDFYIKAPEIKDGGELGDKINKDITKLLKPEIDYCEKAKADGKVIDDEMYSTRNYGEIDYEVYRNGPVLSLVIEAVPLYEGDSGHFVFNIDTENNKQLTEADLLEYKGMDTAQWKKMLQREAAYGCDQISGHFFNYNNESSYDSEYEVERGAFGLNVAAIEMYPEFMIERSCSVASDRFKDEGNTFLNEKGMLTTVIEFFTPAGSGYASRVVVPEERKKQESLFCTFKNNSGEYEVKCDESGTVIKIDGKEYPVEGAFKIYTDAQIVNIMSGDKTIPFAIFVSDDGLVSFIDIDKCMNVGRYYMTEPLFGVSGCKGLSEASEENAEVYGAVHDFAYIYGGAFNQGLLFMDDETGYRAEENGRLHQVNYVDNTFIYDICDEDYNTLGHIEGQLAYLGLTEEGMVYALYYETGKGGFDVALFNVSISDRRFNDDFPLGTFTWIKKPIDPAFDLDTVELRRSYG